METRLVFLLLIGLFCGLCFVVGCIASVIKAVRDRRRIVKNQSERARIGKERGTDELMRSPSSSSSSGMVNPILQRNNSKVTEFKRKDSTKSGRQRKPTNPANSDDEKPEPNYKLVEIPCHGPSDNIEKTVPMSVLEKSYGAHSQSKHIVLNDEALTDQEKEEEDIVNEIVFRPQAIRQDKYGSSGTFLIDKETPVARTRSYQAAMHTAIVTESPSLSRINVNCSSREHILKASC